MQAHQREAQGAFARAGFANDAQRPATPQTKGDVIHSLEFTAAEQPAAAMETFAQVAHVEDHAVARRDAAQPFLIGNRHGLR